MRPRASGAASRKLARALAIRLSTGALGLMPCALGSLIGGAIGRWAAPRLYPVGHGRAIATVRALRPDLAGEAPALVARMWAGAGRVYAELAREHRLCREGRVTVIGAAHLAAIREQGRPLVVAGLHIGNWEVLPIALAYLGANIVQVYQPHPNPTADGFVRRVRVRAARAIAHARGVRAEELFRLVAPSSRAGLELAAAVRKGWTATIFVDEDPGGRCVCPDFAEAPPAAGNLWRAVRLARLTGAAILPAYVERTEGARFVVHLLAPITDASADDTPARLNAALAAVAREHLDQWFMLPSYRLAPAPCAAPPR